VALTSKLLYSINRVVALSRIGGFKVGFEVQPTDPHTEESGRMEDFTELSNAGTSISALLPSVYTSTTINVIAPRERGRDRHLIYNHAGK
jgi:hypothetical protein